MNIHFFIKKMMAIKLFYGLLIFNSSLLFCAAGGQQAVAIDPVEIQVEAEFERRAEQFPDTFSSLTQEQIVHLKGIIRNIIEDTMFIQMF